MYVLSYCKCHEMSWKPTTFSLMGWTQNQILLCLRTGWHDLCGECLRHDSVKILPIGNELLYGLQITIWPSVLDIKPDYSRDRFVLQPYSRLDIRGILLGPFPGHFVSYRPSIGHYTLCASGFVMVFVRARLVLFSWSLWNQVNGPWWPMQHAVHTGQNWIFKSAKKFERSS